jgi:large subunit ribosomal protein L5
MASKADVEETPQTRVRGRDIKDILADWDSNPMRRPRIAKVLINLSTGASGEVLKKAATVVETLSGQKPSFGKAHRSTKEFNIRKYENISAIVTMRGKKAANFIQRVLVTTDNRILYKSFDNYGNVSLGVKEHIQLPNENMLGNVKYEPEIGIFGFNMNIKLERPGFRVMTRRKFRQKIGKNQYVTKAEAQLFMEREFKVELVDIMEQRFY